MSYFYANNFDIFGVVQQAHTSVAICEFRGITVLIRIFVQPKILVFVSRKRRKARERQAVKKPFFHLNFPYFPIATTQIEPFKKAVFFRLHV